MNKITYFTTPPPASELPLLFPGPFADTPHPIAVKACLVLQAMLETSVMGSHKINFRETGKMFGVLVVKDANVIMGSDSI